ncbi:MAG: DNA polymerase I [Bacilli bacterium]|nr:DNA polymerase I [Bacilli bacterium]
MAKIILVDGNNLLFRSYYATAYNGNFMKNSKDFPTNALFGFTNMINKIILEEKPTHIMVAFDKGKTFRHEKYTEYKGGRIETPNELKVQFPIAKQLLTEMGIAFFEIDNYEADDIIGTFARYCDEKDEWIGTIISSDKDLLQLISHDVDMKLLKQKDYIRYNYESFQEDYGIVPKRMVDLKSLMGDSSDNIPGVKGIGEKTALKLLQEYETLDGIYKNISKIGMKTAQKLEEEKENAYMSYDLATIYKEVPIPFEPEELVYRGNQKGLNELYEELEFYSFIKKNKKEEIDKKLLNVEILTDLEDVKLDGEVAIYLELFGSNYHTAEPLGCGIYHKDKAFYVPIETLKKYPEFLKNNPKYTYDLKKDIVSLKYLGIDFNNCIFDTMIAAYLLEYNVKDDIAYLANQFDYDIFFYESIFGKNKKQEKPKEEIIAYHAIMKAKFIYETKELLEKQLEKEGMTSLYFDVELPLSRVLASMECTGVHVSKETIEEMGKEIKEKIDLLQEEIYQYAGCEFNISSPNQLGEVLFEKLKLPHGKKGKTGYSTAIDVLKKLQGSHPIIEVIMEFRTLTKLYTTYIEGLKSTIMKDGKIHTIYTQAITRTGRLSSIEPNLQNIPARNEYGRIIRKAFIPSLNSVILSSDYSQIELRMLAHIADVESLKKAFHENIDIHTKTASDLFKIPLEEVTKMQRRMAKAVNFGIIYGISSYGLSENLSIPPKEAKEFIDNYLLTYPGIKDYMDKIVNQAYQDGYVKTLLGRKRLLPELKNANYMIRSSGERMALNTPIQGTSADLIKKAMVDIYNEFEKQNMKSKMILQVHDELVFDCLLEEKEKVISIVTEKMNQVYPLSIPLEVDIEYGNNWYEAK